MKVNLMVEVWVPDAIHKDLFVPAHWAEQHRAEFDNWNAAHSAAAVLAGGYGRSVKVWSDPES